MKRGLTYKNVVKRFKNGYSIKGLAKLYKCEEWEIQCAIRSVLCRQKRKARSH